MNNGIALPLGLRLSNRYQKTDNQNWTRRPNNTFGTTQATSTSFPDAALQWTYRPRFLTTVISSVGGQIASRRSTAKTFTPSENAGSGDQRSWSQTTSLPINGSITWAFGGGFSTTGGFSTSDREAELPDNSKRLGKTREMSADVGKPLTLPASWNVSAPLRTHLGYSRSLSSSFISSNSGGIQKQSRLSDNGRHTITVNADTDVAENLTFSLTASRSVNFDRNYDRRFTQTVVTAVLNLSFFAGELK